MPLTVAERYRVSPLTRRVDRLMAVVIKAGGIAIIVSVFGMLVFIALQVAPLFRGARVERILDTRVSDSGASVLGLDEWFEFPFLYRGGDEIEFVSLRPDRRVRRVEKIALPPGASVSAFRYDPRKRQIALGTDQGRFGIVSIDYAAEFAADGTREVRPSVSARDFLPIGAPGARIVDVAYGDGQTRRLAAVIQEVGGRRELHALTLRQRRTLVGAGRIEVDRRFDLTSLVAEFPEKVFVPYQAESLLVSTASGRIHYLFLGSDGFESRQVLEPFADLPDPRIASLGFVFGDVSIVLSAHSGEVRIFSLYLQERDGRQMRLFGRTHDLAKLEGGATLYSTSLRNKAFVLGHGSFVSLRHATTSSVRWEADVGFTPSLAAIDPRYTRLALLGADGRLVAYSIDDPHPEAGWKAFFGRVWYEGRSEPEYVWQSTGGTDEFEPKLSLVPLMFGSFKGTLYALLFAVPLALLAAFYTSQFLDPRLRGLVKPTMEIMASLPSVVLGFLAALWLAPILGTRVPSFLLVVLGLPLVALGVASLWLRLPRGVRRFLPAGLEFAAIAPVLVIAGWGMWELGPWVERLLFVVIDPRTGERVADFRLWWPQVTGASFDPRNSLVVGFMMGFAVIPIIFTIAEDSLSNVPRALVAGSLALGASRWQTAWSIVLPTAAAGIFSAVMIGFGRAVGETMIVVMATGNTAVLELNMFSGMRTLSANIAVELPEAPVNSTHYRTLFLGALVLFVFTFLINTAAELLRQRLRERYKAV